MSTAVPSAATPRHPRVPVWLRPLVRRPGEVQFGVLPGGPIVEGLTAAESGMLARLDGTLSLEATFDEAGRAGISRRRWRELLVLTTRLGVVVEASAPMCTHSGTEPDQEGVGGPTSRGGPPPAGHNEAAACVVVDGSGPVAAEIASVVSAECRVRIVHERPDVDRLIADPDLARPHVVVLVGSPVVDPRRGNLWLGHGIPHLPVAAAGPRTTVGPLVDGSPLTPCLWCLDRHRCDRDEAWPTLMRQTALVVPPGAEPPVTSVEGAHEGLTHGLGQLVAGTVALFVSRVVAGQLPPAGVSVEVSLPWPRMDHRRWTPHPLCPGRHLGAAPRPSDPAGHDLPRGA